MAEHENLPGLKPGVLVATMGTGVGLGALVGAIRGRRAPNVPRAPSVPATAAPPVPGGPPVLGTAPKPSTAPTLGRKIEDAATNVNTAILDDMARPINVVRRVAGDKPAVDFEATLRTMTGHAGNQRISGAINDGIFTTDGSIRSTAHRVLAQAYTFMGDSQKKLYNDGLDAMSLLDDMDEAKADGIAIVNENAHRTRLQQIEARARADANVAKLFDVTNEITRTVDKYNNKVAGTVSNSASALFNQRRMYVPREVTREARSLLDAAEGIGSAKKSTPRYDQSNPHLKKVNHKDINTRLVAHSAPNVDMPAPRHLENIAKYIAESVKHGGENIARRELVDKLLEADRRRGDGTTIIRQLRKGNNAPIDGDIMHVWRNGAEEMYEIGDPTLFKSMMFHPHYSLPYLSDLTKLKRLGTTGGLEPAFSWKALMYDVGFQQLSMRTDKLISGPVDAAVKRKMTKAGASESKREMVRNALAGQIRMLDMPYTVAQGFKAGVEGRFKQELVRHAQRNLARAIGEDAASVPAMQVALDEAMQKYLDTRYSQLVRSGYTSQSLAQDWQEASVLDTALEKMGDTQVVRPYKAAMESIRDAGRMGLFCRQVAELEIDKGRGANARELRHISANVREVAADPTRMGTSKFWSGFASTSMFANVIAQSTVHLIRCLSNPAFYPVVASIATYRMAFTMMAEERMGPEETAQWREETPGFRFAGGFPMLNPMRWMDSDPVTRDDLIWMPLGMEVGSVTNVTESIVRGLIGSKAQFEPGAWEASTDALLNLVNINVPTFVDGVALLLGGSPIELHLDEDGKLIFQKEPMTSGPGNGTVGDRRGMGLNTHQEGGQVNIMTDWIHDVMSTALGTAGATLADAIEATIDVPTSPDNTWFDKLGAAFNIVKYDVVTKRMFIPKNLPIIGGEFVNKDSKGTPIADRYYELTGYLDAMHEVQTVEVNGRIGEVTAPSGPVPMMPTQLSDPVLQEQVARVESFFDHPARRAIKEQLSVVSRREKGHRGNPEVKKADQARTSNFYNDQLQDAYRIIMDEYVVFEEQMRADYGPNWSMRNLTRAVRNDKYGKPWGTVMGLVPSLPGH